MEFTSKEAAEDYAKKAGSHTTANVHYYVKEKEPEPGAVRKGTAQPDLDARAQEEVTPKNAATEKQNEIPGRQITPEPDPLVEIRSAVHSNYAGMVAMLGADNRVYLGKEERYHSDGELPGYYDNQDGSLCFVDELRAQLQRQQREISHLRQQIENLQVVTTISHNRKDVERSRAFLSQLVRDIDKCIAELTD